MSTTYIVQAQNLLTRGRYDLAEVALIKEIALEPESGEAFAMLAYCYFQQNKKEEAEAAAVNGIKYSPEYPFAWYVMSLCALFKNSKYEEAEGFIKEALHLNPGVPEYYAQYANIRIQQKKWEEALELANKGLSYNPENPNCRNSKVIILRKLNRHDDAMELINQALKNNPENPITLTNKGWQCLSSGSPKEALEVFRDALRVDPTNTWAKDGLVLALKATNIFYRIFFSYFKWMARLNKKARWGFIIGIYIVMRILRYAALKNPGLEPFILPVIIIYALFVFLTWTIDSFANLLLRLNKYGRYALSRENKIGSNITGVLLILTIVQIGITILTKDVYPFLGALISFFLILPYSGCFHYYPSRKFNILLAYSACLSIAGVSVIVINFLAPESLLIPGMIFAGGLILFQWISNIIK